MILKVHLDGAASYGVGDENRSDRLEPAVRSFARATARKMPR